MRVISPACECLVLAIVAMSATHQTALASCPGGGLPMPGFCGYIPSPCFPDSTGPASWTDTTGTTITTTQTRFVDGLGKSPHSTWGGSVPTGTQPNCSVFGAPAPTATLSLNGRRLIITYDAPNLYCINTGDWPPGITCQNDISSSAVNSVSLWHNGQIYYQQSFQFYEWLYYEHGTLDTLIDLTAPCGTTDNTWVAAIEFNGSRYPQSIPGTGTTLTLPPCRDLRPCPACPEGGGQ
jgi:hypothetical protein